MLCERNDDVTRLRFVYSMYRSVWESFMPRHDLAVESMQRTLREGNSLAFQKRKTDSCRPFMQLKGHTVVLLSVWQRLFKMQAKSFRPIPHSIDAASVQILSNTTLTLIVVFDDSFVTFVHCKLYFCSIKITLGTGRLINIDKLTFD